MTLNKYLRTEINKKIRYLFIEEFCEVCANTENLHLHHVKLFSEIVDETLEELNLPKKEKSEYETSSLKLIGYIVIGKHLDIDYLTLCEECHRTLHKEENPANLHVNRRMKKDIHRNLYMQRVVGTYLENNVGKIMLRMEDRKDIIEILNRRDARNNRLVKSIDALNEALCEYSLNYRIENFSTSRIESGKKKNYNSAWRIIRV